MVPNIIPQIARSVEFRLANAVAQPCKSVSSIYNIPIICSELFQRFNVMKCAAGPQRIDAAIDGVVLIARSAGLGPNCALHKRVCVLDKIVNGR